MIIRAELKCKQTGCEADPCAVDMTARSTREGHRSARLTTSCAWGGSSGCALMMRIPMRS